MSEKKSIKADVSPVRHLSGIWLVPLVALIIGAWMLIHYIDNQGPVITLRLQTAAGIEAGKTEIKARNVKVGVITHVQLSKNYNYIIATAQMNKDATRMLTEDTLFWVVKPRIGREGISGLETLLSGSYIELQPGVGVKKKEKLNFTVLETPPVAGPDAKGTRVVLTYPEAGKLSVGDPVLYEGFTVGRVEKISFEPSTKEANYQLFIFQPYNKLLHSRTRFWLNSGVDLSMSAEGFNLKIGSMESLISGGVSFRVPKGSDEGYPITKQNVHFKLYNNLQDVREQMYDQYLPYVMLFNESVRGLTVGAPVEYRGIRIGTVEKVPLRVMNSNDQSFINSKIPVLVHIELGRMIHHVNHKSLEELKASLAKEFKLGLRATLKTGSFLTGQLFVDAEISPNKTLPKTIEYDGYNVFPTETGGFSEMQKQVSTLLNKFNQLPIEKTVTTLNETLATSKKALASTNQMVKDLNALLDKKSVKNMPNEVRESLQQIQETLRGLSPQSAPYHKLEEALTHFNQVMKEFNPVLKQLNEKPNSLIFSGEKPQDPIPVGGK